MRPWHLTIASRTRLTLFPDPEQRRAVLEKLMELLGEELALFCLVDDHLHCVLVCDETVLQRRTRALTRSIRCLAPVELGSTHVSPVNGRRHMESLVAYLLHQPVKHGLRVHPALWEGGCFPDLVGARLLPGFGKRLPDALPRWDQRALLGAVGLPSGDLSPLSLEELRSLGARRLLEASAAAAGADPALRGRRMPEVRARRAACRLAREAGMSLSEIAWLLEVTPRAVRRMADHPGTPGLTTAVRMRLALEERVAASARR
jgi:REP element-mobilizing transposase RayT